MWVRVAIETPPYARVSFTHSTPFSVFHKQKEEDALAKFHKQTESFNFLDSPRRNIGPNGRKFDRTRDTGVRNADGCYGHLIGICEVRYHRKQSTDLTQDAFEACALNHAVALDATFCCPFSHA